MAVSSDTNTLSIGTAATLRHLLAGPHLRAFFQRFITL